MSTVFLACTGQPMSQRPRFWQPSWRHAAERVLARLAEVDGDRQPLRLAAGARARGGERAHLRQRRVVRRGDRVERRLGHVVPRVEPGARDRRRPVVARTPRRAPAAGRSRRRASRRRRRPRRSRETSRSSRTSNIPPGLTDSCHSSFGASSGSSMKSSPREAPAALEDADAMTRFGQPAGGDPAAEARPDHDDVVPLRHRGPSSSLPRPRGRFLQRADGAGVAGRLLLVELERLDARIARLELVVGGRRSGPAAVRPRTNSVHDERDEQVERPAR